jgi:hypothetical protein
MTHAQRLQTYNNPACQVRTPQSWPPPNIPSSPLSFRCADPVIHHAILVYVTLFCACRFCGSSTIAGHDTVVAIDSVIAGVSAEVAKGVGVRVASCGSSTIARSSAVGIVIGGVMDAPRPSEIPTWSLDEGVGTGKSGQQISVIVILLMQVSHN